MIITSLRILGIRCFDDTGDIAFARGINVVVGVNNAGKSTLLKGILDFQNIPFLQADYRPKASMSAVTIAVDEVKLDDYLNAKPAQSGHMRFVHLFTGGPEYFDFPTANVTTGTFVFHPARPLNAIVPFMAKRKAPTFSHEVTSHRQADVDGTFSYLYSRIDQLATYGHPDHDAFKQAIQEIVGLPITMRASPGGKEAGFYFDRDNFVTLDRMGDGVTEMVGLITELCLARDKIFLLEEPETNLHPRGLKALLALVRKTAEANQFFIATHSNVVVRELAGEEESKVFRVYRDGDTYTSPSKVEEVERTPEAHTQLLRELGYEFTDFNLHDGWLFLEESSAERIIRDILIPHFAPALRGRLRTYSADGAGNLAPSVFEFQRLIVFVHLQPVYQNRIWIRADGDKAGIDAVDKIREKFPALDADALAAFRKPQFEEYYPECFQEEVCEVLAIADQQVKRKRKTKLLHEVLEWTEANGAEAKAAWALSADEPIKFLLTIVGKLDSLS